MIYGFTGTRYGGSIAQHNWLAKKLESEDIDELHHGACVGADRQAHIIAISYGIRVIAHPPTDTSKMMPIEELIQACVLEAKPYLERNRDIVAACDHLLALPRWPMDPRSGTWTTVRYAQKAGKPVSICMPDGEEMTR